MLAAHTHFAAVPSHPCKRHPTETSERPCWNRWRAQNSSFPLMLREIATPIFIGKHLKYNQKAKILCHHKNFGFLFSMPFSVFPHLPPGYPRYDGQFFLLPNPTSANPPKRQWFLRKTVCGWASQAHRPQWYKAAHLW